MQSNQPPSTSNPLLRQRRPSLRRDSTSASDAGSSSHTRTGLRTPQHTPTRRATAGVTVEGDDENSNWFDLPLAFAFVPAAGSLLTGSDLLKDFLHLAFLLYYLHNLIKVPWRLYQSARARRPVHPHAHHPTDDRLRALARSELRLAELIYLFFTIVSPFLGAVLLRYMSKLLSIDTVSTFSTSLFVLATGIRPWRHLIDLLQNRTEALHDVVHTPAETELDSKVSDLADEVRALRALVEAQRKETEEEVGTVRERVEGLSGETEKRLRGLEMVVESLQKNAAAAPIAIPVPEYYATPPTSREESMTITIPAAVLNPFGWINRLAAANDPPPRLSAKLIEISDDEGLLGEDDDTETETEGKRIRKLVRTRGVVGKKGEEDGWVEAFVHLVLFPLRFVRSLAAMLFSQLQ